MPDARVHAADDWATFQTTLRENTPHTPVTFFLAAANVAVFVGMLISGAHWLVPNMEDLLRWGSNYGPLTVSQERWRLLTCGFVHIGLVHLALNVWVLLSVCRLVERLYGNGFFALIYLVSGLIGSLTSLCWNQETVSTGASAAIFGSYGALFACLPRRQTRLPKEALLSIRDSTIAYAGYSLFYAVVQSGRDNPAHMGGLCAGLVLGVVLWRPLTGEERKALARRRLAAGLGVSALMLCSLPFFISSYVEDYRRAIRWYVQREQGALALLGDLVRESAAGSTPDAETAKRLKEECLPLWDAIVEDVEELRTAEGSADKKRYQLLAYLARLRRRAVQRRIAGLRASDQQQIRAADALQHRADHLLAKIQRRIDAGPLPQAPAG